MPSMLDKLTDVFDLLDFEVIRDAAGYGWRKAVTEATWTSEGKERHGLARWLAFARNAVAPRHPWPKTWQSLGRIIYIQPTERGADLRCERGRVTVTFLTEDLVQIRCGAGETDTSAPPQSYAVERPQAEWPMPALVRHQEPTAYLIQSKKLIVGIRLETGQLFIAKPDGSLLRSDLDTGWSANGAWRHRVTLTPQERVLGLGERTTAYNRRGATHVLWNTDPAGYRDGDDPINLNIPVAVHAVPREGNVMDAYLVFYDNPTYTEFDLGETVTNVADHRFAGGELRYYLTAGPLDRLLERYTALTGRHPLQPLWMLGFHQSRWSYDSEERVRKLASDFRKYDVPCDAIHLDIDYMDGFRCFTWNREAFPNPRQMAQDLREDGFKLISIIDPGIKQDPNYEIYREGVKGDHFVTAPDGKTFHAPVWPGNSAFPDFTDPPTRTWWGELYRPLLGTGLAGFWNDMNEPAAFAPGNDRTLPDNLLHAMEGAGSTHADAHNVYGMLMARATRAGLERLQPERRPVVITRAGWAGVQRYATSWTADNESTWDALRLTIPMMLGLGLSGVGFSGPDVGGFIGEADGELFTRWTQMAAFMPFFRAHTAKGTRDQEPWSYGEPYLSIVRRFIQLRYELLPYLYTAMWQMTHRGWPVVRPLMWGTQGTSEVGLWDVDDAFLCGDKLLVAPALEPGLDRRDVVLPPGAWYDFWTNARHSGPSTLQAMASLEMMPLLVREGTVLTMGEFGPCVEKRKRKFLRLNVYPLAAPGTAVSELYEDAGSGIAYQEGDQRVSRFVVKQDAETLSVTWEKAGPYEPPYEHLALTVCGLRRVPREISADGETFGILQSDLVKRSVLLGVPVFDQLDIKL